MDSPIGVPKNGPELGIFNKKDLVFFHQKCFLEHIGISEGKKSKKKTLSKRVDGSPWIHPSISFRHCSTWW